MISVLLIEANRVMRIGIKSSLGEKAGFSIVAEFDTIQQSLPIAASVQCDVLLIDLTLLRAAGTAGITAFGKACPGTRLLVYNPVHERSCGKEILKFGAFAYLTKQCTPAELRIAIATVASGQPYINESMAGLLREIAFHPQNLAQISLSSRETRIFKMLSFGIKTEGISAQLDLSVRTVGMLKSRIMAKIALLEHDGLLRFAMARGFV